MAKNTTEEEEADWINAPRVATKLKVGYQRARELMFKGKLGESRLNGRSLEVKESEVDRYQNERKGGSR